MEAPATRPVVLPFRLLGKAWGLQSWAEGTEDLTSDRCRGQTLTGEEADGR